MKEDIPFLPVEGIAVAVVQKPALDDNFDWEVFLINENNVPIENAMITSKGYGTKDGEKQETSTLRHMIEYIPPKSAELIEPIMPDVFHLTNQYWVSYYIDGQIYDKKFIFVPDSIVDNNLTSLPIIEHKGILHR